MPTELERRNKLRRRCYKKKTKTVYEQQRRKTKKVQEKKRENFMEWRTIIKPSKLEICIKEWGMKEEGTKPKQFTTKIRRGRYSQLKTIYWIGGGNTLTNGEEETKDKDEEYKVNTKQQNSEQPPLNNKQIREIQKLKNNKTPGNNWWIVQIWRTKVNWIHAETITICMGEGRIIKGL
jgi:hypothetical protein